MFYNTIYIFITNKNIILFYKKKFGKLKEIIKSKLNIISLKNTQNLDKEYLINIINKYIQNNKIKFAKIKFVVNFECINRIILYPNLSNKNLKNVVKNNINNEIPLDLNNYYLDYRIIMKNKKNVSILLALVKKEFIENYLYIFNKLDFKVKSLNLYQNVLSMYLEKISIDKNSLMCVDEDSKLIFIFVKLGKLNYIKEFYSTNINLDKIFSIHKDFNNNINIDNLYIEKENSFISNYFIDTEINIINIVKEDIFLDCLEFI